MFQYLTEVRAKLSSSVNDGYLHADVLQQQLNVVYDQVIADGAINPATGETLDSSH